MSGGLSSATIVIDHSPATDNVAQAGRLRPPFLPTPIPIRAFGGVVRSSKSASSVHGLLWVRESLICLRHP
ncbi:hypothetical protein E2562_006441 [Oryza meyeriana var. granulata]|uniref:Uncharacterized protein n=1 Tax=Oryza meyeriana var. granulata TaxID=110450 RepID=A0A6G1CP09_9ORYZ|nr:hypothetical protein E2562_006441 [Oryza meyeriana var. granulata]